MDEAETQTGTCHLSVSTYSMQSRFRLKEEDECVGMDSIYLMQYLRINMRESTG